MLRSMARCWLAIVVLIQAAGGAFAQQLPDPPKIDNPPPAEVAANKARLMEFFGYKTPYEFWLTLIILACGLLFLLITVRFLHSISRDKIEHATRAVTIILIIVATLVLITAGYSNEQIAPAFGLFGTIVGYILGRSQNKDNDQNGDQGAAPGGGAP